MKTVALPGNANKKLDSESASTVVLDSLFPCVLFYVDKAFRRNRHPIVGAGFKPALPAFEEHSIDLAERIAAEIKRGLRND
jgi:hypothetical protein